MEDPSLVYKAEIEQLKMRVANLQSICNLFPHPSDIPYGAEVTDYNPATKEHHDIAKTRRYFALVIQHVSNMEKKYPPEFHMSIKYPLSKSLLIPAFTDTIVRVRVGIFRKKE